MLDVRDDGRTKWRPVIDPGSVAVDDADAAVRAVDVAKITRRPPIITVNSVVFIEVINVFDVGLDIAAAIGVGALHGTDWQLAVDLVGANNGWRFGRAGTD